MIFIQYAGFRKKARFSKSKNSPNLLTHDRKGKIMENINWKYFRDRISFMGSPVDGMNILQIRSWDSTYRSLCRKFGALNHSTISSTPLKGCSITECFYLLHFPFDESYVCTHPHICMYMNPAYWFDNDTFLSTITTLFFVGLTRNINL